MNYKEAYLRLFSQISELIKAIEATNNPREQMNIALQLKRIQVECEEICIADKQP